MKYLLFTWFLFINSIAIGQLAVQDPTCEYMINPKVVDKAHPRLSCINQAKASQRGQKQFAYHLKVASSPALLKTPDLWDRGKVTSDESNRIFYVGKTLKSRQNCYWQVRMWDKDNKPLAWSSVANWHMGLLAESDWKAEWISAPWQGEEAIPKPKGGPNERTKIFPLPLPCFENHSRLRKKTKKRNCTYHGFGLF